VPATTNAAGGGSSAVTPERSVNALTAIRNRAGAAATITYNDGSDPVSAAAAAKAADVAIVFGNDLEGEGADRACLSLSCSVIQPQMTAPTATPTSSVNQDLLISSVAAVQANTVVVLQAGAPVLMPWLSQVRGVLDAYYPGEAGGPAIAGVLFGDVNPSGRLPFTIPAAETDTPTATDPARYPGAVYSEGVFTGYRWYDQQHVTPLFPFGYGLSYTSFAYHNLEVSKVGPGTATVSVQVTNTGGRAGAEVVQLYLGMPSAPNAPEPPSWLRDFAKVQLSPGQTTTVTFQLSSRAFSHWDTASNSWQIQPGCYTARVGSSDRDIVATAPIAQGGATGCTA
jgi:beta-glucosidase